jgi:hypothetical protein
VDHIVREVIEIAVHPNSINKKDGQALSKLWKSPIHYVKECQKAFRQDVLQHYWPFQGLTITMIIFKCHRLP